jgi:hypothetical protein
MTGGMKVSSQDMYLEIIHCILNMDNAVSLYDL